ncbi:MAG: hypothetical protein FWD61_12640 [Phycisphaerales bacterium]|nr:hypothetical protein [Phycisphaerales bacterium]
MKQIAVLFLMLVAFAGCATSKSLQIEPVGKKTTPVVLAFDTAYCYFDRDQNLHIVMRAQATNEKNQKTYDQIFTARVFWRPVGGKTSLNSTSINVTYRYLLIAPDEVGMYEGAGFLRFSDENRKGEIKINLVESNMRLTEASDCFVDTLGRARVRGNFIAKEDNAKAVEMLKAAQQEFFAHSLSSKPRSAATQPSK